MPTTFFSTFNYSDSLTIAGISFFTAIICEALSWLFFYRRISYDSLNSTINKACKKLQTLKSKKSRNKKIHRLITSLNLFSSDLSSKFEFKSYAVVAGVLLLGFGFLYDLYGGQVVAKLPFVPLRFVQMLSHIGLQGDDPTDCSVAFLYFLCSISMWTNLHRFLWFSPPRGAAVAGAGAG